MGNCCTSRSDLTGKDKGAKGKSGTAGGKSGSAVKFNAMDNIRNVIT